MKYGWKLLVSDLIDTGYRQLRSLIIGKKYTKVYTSQLLYYVAYDDWAWGMGMAEPLICIILTDKWLLCVPYLRIFCFTYSLWPIHTANLQVIKDMGWSDLFLKIGNNRDDTWTAHRTDLISTFVNIAPNVKSLGYSCRE